MPMESKKPFRAQHAFLVNDLIFGDFYYQWCLWWYIGDNLRQEMTSVDRKIDSDYETFHAFACAPVLIPFFYLYTPNSLIASIIARRFSSLGSSAIQPAVII